MASRPGEAGVVVLSGPPCSGKSEVGRLLGADWSRSSRHYVEVDGVAAGKP